jgi:hypothetical protein
VELRRILEAPFENLVMACYAEEQDNQVKIDALAQVKRLASEGNKVYRVESVQDSTLVGVQVGHEDEVLFSKFRKNV